MKRLITIVLVVTQCHLFAFRDVKSTFYFDSDIDTLNHNQLSELQVFIKSLSDYRQYKEIYVAGYTDADGTSEYNIGLSKRRADFVTTLLIKDGMPEMLIDKNFKGENSPVAANTTEINKSRNRRVEVILRLFDIKKATDVIKEINGNPEQVFLIDNTKESTVIGKNGMKIVFPAFCFQLKEAADYKEIKIKLTEVTNVVQGLFSGVLAESRNELLESGGMFKIEAIKNNVELKMKNNVEYIVEIDRANVKNDMTVFASLTNNTDGLVRWENTNMPFKKVSSFNGNAPYLRLDEKIINNWHIENELKDIADNYELKLPSKPKYPKKPVKPGKPYEPKISDSKYKLPLFQRMFLSKAKKEEKMRKQYDLDYASYLKKMEVYQTKLINYKIDSASLKDRIAQYDSAFKYYRDSIYLEIKKLDMFRLAVYAEALTKNFDKAKEQLLYQVKNNSLRTYNVYQDMLINCYKTTRQNDLNASYLKQFSYSYKELKLYTMFDFPQLVQSAFSTSNCDYAIYPVSYSSAFLKLLERDKTVKTHIDNAIDVYMEEQTKSGIFDKNNFRVFYQASLNSFGWINCDRFTNYKKDELFTLQVPNYQLHDKNLIAIIKDINSQISIPLTASNIHSVQLPKHKEIIIVAIGLDTEMTPMYAVKSVTANSNMKIDLTFKHSKLSEIKDVISSI